MSYLDQYQEFTKTTAVYPDANKGNILELMYLANGLTSEAGEVAGKIKKAYRDGIDLDEPNNHEYRLKIISEMGDCYWYLAMLANALNTSCTRCLVDNRDKLVDRQNRDMIQGDGDTR